MGQEQKGAPQPSEPPAARGGIGRGGAPRRAATRQSAPKGAVSCVVSYATRASKDEGRGHGQGERGRTLRRRAKAGQPEHREGGARETGEGLRNALRQARTEGEGGSRGGRVGDSCHAPCRAPCAS